MTNDLRAEMQSMLADLTDGVVKMNCQYLQLAAAIMRECDCPGMAGDIDQVRYALANRMRDKRKEYCPQCKRDWEAEEAPND